MKDLPAIWGQWIAGWYRSQAPSIATLTAFPIESFSTDPNDVANMRAISFPQAKPWDVEVVAKNFDAAMNHLRKFNGIRKHGMAVVDKVAISGQSPELHVRYSLQLYVIPPSVPPAADPKISGAGGGGAAPGGGGVGGGMMPMGSGGGKMGGM